MPEETEPAENTDWDWPNWNWINPTGAGVIGMALAGPAGGAVGVANSMITDNPESTGGTATSLLLATGVVVVCAVGGHALMATAGIAGAGVNAAHHYFSSEEQAETNEELQGEDEDQAAMDALLEDLDTSCLDEPEEVEPSRICRLLGCLPCFAGLASPVPPKPEAEGEKADYMVRRSLHALRQRQQAVDAESPAVLLYETTNLPSKAPAQRSSMCPATFLPFNGHGQLLANEHFAGRMLMMHRPPDRPDKPWPYAEYFAKRTRRWELRVQGRFLKIPAGKLQAGVILKDFDYRQQLGLFTSWLSTLSLAPLEYVLGCRALLSFGDRGKASLKEDAMLAQVVSGLQVLDQIIVTPPGADPPDLDGELEGKGITRRGAASSAAWSAMVEEVEAGIELGNTYTFCFWSAAKFIDLIGASGLD
ncbi:unnamed protein product [Effrenium voratum]|nr:unnamed protein product [Effrenium voratum]